GQLGRLAGEQLEDVEAAGERAHGPLVLTLRKLLSHIGSGRITRRWVARRWSRARRRCRTAGTPTRPSLTPSATASSAARGSTPATAASSTGRAACSRA